MWKRLRMCWENLRKQVDWTWSKLENDFNIINLFLVNPSGAACSSLTPRMHQRSRYLLFWCSTPPGLLKSVPQEIPRDTMCSVINWSDRMITLFCFFSTQLFLVLQVYNYFESEWPELESKEETKRSDNWRWCLYVRWRGEKNVHMFLISLFHHM